MKTKPKVHWKLLFAILFATINLNSYAVVIYVNQMAVGANDGTSWANAYADLSDALSSATSGDEIWVAQGVYKPSVPIDLNGDLGIDNREATFNIPTGVILYGGFDGTEVNLDQRNFESNHTILSGDIDNNDVNGDANNVAEVISDIVGNNAYHVVYTENVDASTRLDGFIITAGNANISTPVNMFDPNLDGGGWFNNLVSPGFESSPTIFNCLFIGNYAESEGGAYYSLPGPNAAISNSEFQFVKFMNNASNNSGGAFYSGSFNSGIYNSIFFKCDFESNSSFRRGGAVYLVGDHSSFDSCNFTSNQTTAISEGETLPGSGGAVNLVSSNAQFTNCYFTQNHATGNPTGAFEGGGGGAVYMSTNEPQTDVLGESKPRFISCGFYMNTASDNGAAWGGAITHLSDAGRLLPDYINCVFAGNEAQNHGGAVASFTRIISEPMGFSSVLEPDFTNCTFTANSAGQLGGALYNSGWLQDGLEILTSMLVNSVLWNNSAITDGPEVYNTANNLVSNSLIEGSGGSGGGWNLSIGTDNGNNIDENPDFSNAGTPLGVDGIPGTNDDGLLLGPASPAVNEGNNLASGLVGINLDYRGTSRVLSGTVDMGAYERSGIILPDFKLFWLYEWEEVDPPCLRCPWAFRFTDFIYPLLIWKERGVLKDYGDYGEITGELMVSDNADITFDVYIKLIPRERKRGDQPENNIVNSKNRKDWQLSGESYLFGTGTTKGKIKLKSDRSKYRLGFGANGKDGDYGLGGKSFYKARLKCNSRKIKFRGKAFANMDAELCTEECEETYKKNNPDYLELKSSVINQPHPILSMKIYPQPAADFVHVVLGDSFDNIETIDIFSIDGKKKASYKVSQDENEIEINTTHLSPGLYLLKISTHSGYFETQKLIIE